MHSTHERFWKQIYACGAEPFYWRQGDGKEIIWATVREVPDATKGLPSLCNGSLHGTRLE